MAESASSRYDLTRWRWHTDTKPSWFVDNRLSNVDIIEIYISSISYNYINFLWKYTSKDATHRVVLVCRQPLINVDIIYFIYMELILQQQKKDPKQGLWYFPEPLRESFRRTAMPSRKATYIPKKLGPKALYIPLAMVEVPHKSVTSSKQKVLFKVVICLAALTAQLVTDLNWDTVRF